MAAVAWPRAAVDSNINFETVNIHYTVAAQVCKGRRCLAPCSRTESVIPCAAGVGQEVYTLSIYTASCICTAIYANRRPLRVPRQVRAWVKKAVEAAGAEGLKVSRLPDLWNEEVIHSWSK